MCGLVDSNSGGVSVHPSFESSLVVEVKKVHHFDSVLMELKDSVLVKMNKSFILGGSGILRYQDRLCVPDVDGFADQNCCKGSWFQIFYTSRLLQDLS